MLTSPRHGVETREWRIALGLAVFLMVITTIPYLIGFADQRGDSFGGFLFGVTDGNSYIAKMREGASGNGLFHLVYTSEINASAWLFVPYLTAGKIAGLVTNSNSPGFIETALVIFHLMRIICGIAAILVSFRFLALFLPRGGTRWAALVVISFGGGFGWLLFIFGLGGWFGSLPIDLYIPEAYTFLMLYGLPHLALARAMLLGGFVLLGTRRDWQSAVIAGGGWFVMALCVPFDVAVLYALLGSWGIALTIRTRQLPIRWAIRPAIAAIIPTPIFLYSIVVVGQNPAFAIFNIQNKLPSPNPIQYVIGFGLFAIPSFWGICWAWRHAEHQPLYALLVAWVIAAPILAYAPVSVQRRLIEGIWVPLCVLGIAGIRFVIVPKLARHRAFRRRRINTRRVARYAAVMILVFSLSTTVLLLLTGTVAVVSHSAQIYHSAAETAALDWLNDHSTDGAVVLSSFDTGNYLPARTHLHAFWGHGVETLYSDQKRILVTHFFNGTQTLKEIQTPEEDPIRYVFYGPAEQTLIKTPSTNDPAARWENGLTIVYQRDGYLIFQVP